MAKPLRGYLINGSTGDQLIFKYNPQEIETSRSVDYAELTAPGVSYPRFQFIKGNAETFGFEIFLHDFGGVESSINFLENLEPPRQNTYMYTQPPIVLVSYGTFVRQAITTDLRIRRTRFDLSLKTIEATANISFKAV